MIETVPRKGYRLIAPVAPEEVKEPEASPPRYWAFVTGVLALVVAGALAFTFDIGGVRTRLMGDVAPGEITSIAVLPLDNLMNDPEQDYFVEGMHEALIRELSKIGALRVISRTSTMQFKGTKTSLPGKPISVNFVSVILCHPILGMGITYQERSGPTERVYACIHNKYPVLIRMRDTFCRE